MNEYIILDLYDRKFIIEYLYCVEEYCTMTVKVESKGFRGESNFCISKTRLTSILVDFEAVSKNLSGSVQMGDMDSDAVIYLEMKRFGKLEISGQIGRSHTGYYMCFKFDSDQTVLARIIDFIKSIL